MCTYICLVQFAAIASTATLSPTISFLPPPSSFLSRLYQLRHSDFDDVCVYFASLLNRSRLTSPNIYIYSWPTTVFTVRWSVSRSQMFRSYCLNQQTSPLVISVMGSASPTSLKKNKYINKTRCRCQKIPSVNPSYGPAGDLRNMAYDLNILARL